ncbi:MAG: hypothetical protein E7616_10600 [Ruminococcaceae bacterium]|nr:hypothetical protein [Oscillospiraceae bacterium]
MKEILRKFERLLWEECVSYEKNAEELYHGLEVNDADDTWYWKDIDYSDEQRSFWPAAEHFKRIRAILNGFGKARLSEDKPYAAKMIGALKYWLIHDFENPNWWWNEIGTPLHVGNIAMMMHSVLDEATLAQAAEIVAKGSMSQIEMTTARWTGANLMWCVLNTIRHALITEDAPLLRLAADRLSEEITVGLSGGIQKDLSFFQHGPRLYSGGYGRSFVCDVSKILFLLNETEFQLPCEKAELVLSFILEGLRPMTQGKGLDWACIGREISRVDGGHVGKLESSLELLLQTPGLPRKRELKDFLRSMHGGTQGDGTKYFEKAFMLCHHFDGIYVGAKFLNDKLYGAEIINGEGALCYNMSYGTHTCIMRTGEEYLNINPVWDYSRIPGTTSRLETDAQLLMHVDWRKCPLPNDHFGGIEKDRRAAIYELAEHDGIKILVTDFAFENGFVCLGTEWEINRTGGEELVTTVDQCLARGPVSFEKESVIHNSIRYTPLQSTHMEAKVETKYGSWQRNNAALSDETVSADVFTLSIPHPAGRRCEYAYMISSAHTPMPEVEVLRNDCEVQAIRLPDGSLMAVFHRSCVFSENGYEIAGEAGRIELNVTNEQP